MVSECALNAYTNKPFSEKIESYKNNPLLNQQAEIKEFAIDNTWKTDSIQKRHKVIIDFAVKRWDFGRIVVSI